VGTAGRSRLRFSSPSTKTSAYRDRKHPQNRHSLANPTETGLELRIGPSVDVRCRRRRSMKRIAVLLMLSLPAMAAEHNVKHRMLAVSQFVLGASISADLGSSFGLRETNPMAGPSGVFGARQAVILGSISGAALAGQFWLMHKHPRTEPDRALVFANFGGAAFHGWAAWHNFDQRRLAARTGSTP